MEQDSATHEKEVAIPADQSPPIISVEEMVEQCVGHINRAQIVQAILASISTFFDSQQTFISVFTHAHPTWHCTNNNNTSTSCSSSSNICSLSKSEWAWDSGNVHTSVISEWDLECASTFITSFPTTSYFVGCLLGGLVLATLGDSSSLGRKNLLVISSLVMSLAALASAFSSNIWVYSGFRFLSGAGRAPIAISALVLLTEKVGKRWRTQLTMLAFFHISFGILALTGIAYVTRDSSWRTLYLCTSIPGIICSIVTYFFLCESPRWLFMQGREKDAIAILRRIGSSTIHIFPINLTNMYAQQRVPNSTNPFTSLKILFKRRWAVKRLLASMVLSFGIGLMYFGMFLGVGNLGFNIYLTSLFNVLLLLSSYLLTFLFWIPRCNRRSSVLGFCTISGATSIIFSVLGRDLHQGILIGLELVSLFCACMAYNVVLMYLVELFPTCVRNSASSLVRQAMILGSVFDPMLILLGKRNLVYSYGVFGSIMLLCGFLVIFLPETKGKVLCDTMEEQECKDNAT